jgi:hypothetical protein
MRHCNLDFIFEYMANADSSIILFWNVGEQSQVIKEQCSHSFVVSPITSAGFLMFCNHVQSCTVIVVAKSCIMSALINDLLTF